MEQLLTLSVDDLNQKRIPLTQCAIAAKARSLFDKIQQKEGGNETFTASKGSFARFKQCCQIHCIKISGEAASADIEATRVFTAEFKKIFEDNGCPPDCVFNMDETGLYWIKLPSGTYISREEKSASGFKASKDQLTMLLGGNASGTLKLKPLLVYHSETPRVMKGILKSRNVTRHKMRPCCACVRLPWFRPVTVEACVNSQVSVCGICGRKSGTVMGFSMNTSVFLCHYCSISTPYSFIPFIRSFIHLFI